MKKALNQKQVERRKKKQTNKKEQLKKDLINRRVIDIWEPLEHFSADQVISLIKYSAISLEHTFIFRR